MGTLPKPRHACCHSQSSPNVMQPRPRYTAKAKAVPLGMLPWLRQPHRHATKAKACSPQGQGTSPLARCQGSLVGTQLRLRHVARKGKARRHWHAAKAKACMLPRPRKPHGHAAKAKACMLSRPRKPHGYATKAKACMLPRPWQPYEHVAKAKACIPQGQGTSP